MMNLTVIRGKKLDQVATLTLQICLQQMDMKQQKNHFHLRKIKMNLFDGYQEEYDEQPIPKEKILQRIDSHKGVKSYQWAKQLSSKWATDVGPRIGCMRDYPSELQAWVLEQSNLSPKSRNTNASPRSFSRFSTMDTTPFSLFRETTAVRSSLAPEHVTLSQTTL